MGLPTLIPQTTPMYVNMPYMEYGASGLRLGSNFSFPVPRGPKPWLRHRLHKQFGIRRTHIPNTLGPADDDDDDAKSDNLKLLLVMMVMGHTLGIVLCVFSGSFTSPYGSTCSQRK